MLVRHSKGGGIGYTQPPPNSPGVSMGHALLSAFTEDLGEVAHLER